LKEWREDRDRFWEEIGYGDHIADDDAEQEG
jgi:hypothetical protein